MTSTTDIRIDQFVEWYNTAKFKPLKSFDGKGHAKEVIESCCKFVGEKPRDYIGASSLGSNTLQLGLKKLGFPNVTGDGFNVKTMLIFHFGHVFESMIITLMKSYGVDCDCGQDEVVFGEEFNSSVAFKGHIDLITSGDTLVEVKTMASGYFKQFVKEPNNFRGYYTQLALYYYGLKEKKGLEDVGWLCFDKDTFEIAFVRPDMERLQAEFSMAKEKMYYLANTTKIEDILNYPLPSLKPEKYRKKETGRWLLPISLRRSPYCSCFYNTYEERDGYKKLKTYVDIENPPSKDEIIGRLVRKRDEIIEQNMTIKHDDELEDK